MSVKNAYDNMDTKPTLPRYITHLPVGDQKHKNLEKILFCAIDFSGLYIEKVAQKKFIS